MGNENPNANPATEVTPPVEAKPPVVETVEGLKAQMRSLNTTHEATMTELKNLKADRASYEAFGTRLASIEGSIAQDRVERSSQAIQAMLEGGDDEGANREAAKQIKSRVGALGLNLAEDPRLARVRNDNAVKGLEALNALEPMLATPVPQSNPEPAQNPAPSSAITKESLPKELMDALEQEFKVKHGLLKVAQAGVAGSGQDMNDMSPHDQILAGLKARNEH